MKRKYKLKKDIIIAAGTVLTCEDGSQRKYIDGNYGTMVSLTPNVAGEIIIGIDDSYPEEENEWFERITTLGGKR